MSSTSLRKKAPPRPAELARRLEVVRARRKKAAARRKKKAPKGSEQSEQAPRPRVQLSLLGDDPEVTGPSSDECYTPSSILEPVAELLGGIDTDPAWSPLSLVRPRVAGYTIGQDGLAQVWTGSVWLNPPYSAPAEWLRRAAEHAATGERVAALISLDPTTKAWRHTLGANALGLWPTRIKFAGAFAGGGAARFSCALVLWNVEIEAAIARLPRVAWYQPRGRLEHGLDARPAGADDHDELGP